MRQTAVDIFTRHRLSLEGVLTTPESIGQLYPTLVVCHSHPMLGGNMEHRLVTAICTIAHRDGIASLRFNFRGVGGSQGTFSNGPSEQEDVRAALEFVQHLPAVDGARLALVGYSFGASMVLGGLGRLKAAHSLVLIAPPVSSVRNSWIKKDRRPKLFIVGRSDRAVPSVELQRTLDEIHPPVAFVELADADHTLAEQEEAVAERVSAFLLETLPPPRDQSQPRGRWRVGWGRPWS